MSSYLIRRHDAVYAVVERYNADMYCSDDREYYRIAVVSEELPDSPYPSYSPAG
ncbi:MULTISPECIES: hypothetical protein [unclassified Cyanobium]|uniref:hypothetical protein n=1 Tax=unclassified Cyanobium TaxID=2627006 RepID=UPI0020CF5035|nr:MULTISPECIES: hypothetical protein [unclassified Cyanobium]MCP9777701.1 hypothetical protein [Cyanobium sp. Tous-M-B4]MCP9875397.1 hypothetical protein [Cyanobium sp. A2C-AMD]